MLKRALLPVLLMLSACGFHLRGQSTLPFQTLYIQSSSDYTPFIGELKRAVQGAGVQLADSTENAQLTLNIVSESASKQILSLSAAGRVLEYQLRLSVSFRAYDQAQQDWLPAEVMVILRNLSYDDTQVLAKEQEEVLLFQDMRSDAVQQMMRRLSHARPPPAKQ